MAKINMVILSGNITKDPEITTVGDNIKRARFTLAQNSKKANGEPVAEYFDCVAFRGTAEILEKYTKKGSGLTVSGKLATNTITSEDGTSRKYVNILVNEVELHPKKAENVTVEEEDETLPF